MRWLLVRINFVSFHIIVCHYLKRMFGYMCIFCVVLFAIPLTLIPSLVPVFLPKSSGSEGDATLNSGKSFSPVKLLHYLKTLMLDSGTRIFNASFAMLNGPTKATDINFHDLNLLATQVSHEFLYN